MTLYEFNLLPKEDQRPTLWMEADFVVDRMEGKFTVFLYQLYSFYVEVWYDGNENEIYKTRSFSSTAQLEPYLNKIDITNLIYQL